MAQQEPGASQELEDGWQHDSWETLPGIEVDGESGSSQAHGESQSQEYFDAQSQPQDTQQNELCPIIDKDTKPFRLMDLPTELRIEIYRACLTRPFDVLLARNILPADKPAEPEDTGDIDTVTGSNAASGWQAPSNAPTASRSTFSPLLAPPTATPPNGNGNGNINNSSLRQFPSPFRNAANRARAVRLGRSSPRIAAVNSTQTQNQTPVAQNRSLIPVNSNMVFRSVPAATTRGRHRMSPSSETLTQKLRPQAADPLIVNILRTNKTIYKEARNILYGENAFLLDLDSALPTLTALHQRSRGQIRNLRVTIPTHNEILERFAEVVRLSLRYCWRLQKFHINMPFVLPGADGSGTSGNTTVYANAFDILRWLPRQCEVVLEGNVCEEIRAVVDRNANLAKNLDEVRRISLKSSRHALDPPPSCFLFLAAAACFLLSHLFLVSCSVAYFLVGQLAYARRQLISNDTQEYQDGG